MTHIIRPTMIHELNIEKIFISENDKYTLMNMYINYNFVQEKNYAFVHVISLSILTHAYTSDPLLYTHNNDMIIGMQVKICNMS